MAGAGYKLFNTGDVLTAAQVNTYLQEQVVMVFANATTRTTALTGVLAEGMMSYLQDTNAVEVYNGTSWVNVGNAGDITEVQAGVGISIASGTGPIPVITNSSTDLITTAGDILYGTAADTMARLGIGTAGQVLKVNSGATAPEWGTVGGGGKVLQVVSTTKTDTFTSTSTSFADITGLSVSITPSSASSKVMVFYNVTGSGDSGVNTSSLRLVRGSTAINIGDAASVRTPATNGIFEGEQTAIGNASMNFLDSPATTSATTYKVQVRCNNTGTSFINRSENDSDQGQNNRTTSTITVMEIGA